MNTFQWIFFYFTTLLLFFVGIKLYFKFTRKFCTSRRRLDGHVAIVTGSNSGIGFETARDFARRGAKVIMACRDLTKADRAADQISRETKNRSVIVRKLDLGSLSSIRIFCKQILKEESRLDILVNNAGVAYASAVAITTEDGLEGHFATNHLGPFLLTNILLGLMMKTGSSRIVNVSSVFHKTIKTLDMDNLNSEKTYEPRIMYGKTKLYNILFTTELNRKIERAGFQNKVTVNAVHPGIVKTNIFRHAKTLRLWQLLLPIVEPFFINAWEGSQTSIKLAVSEDLNGISGLYWAQCKNAVMSKLAEDASIAENLWEQSAKYVKLQPNEFHLSK